MKKSIYVILLVMILAGLSGCSENKRIFILQPFKCDVQLLNDAENIEGVFVYEDKNSMYIDFTANDIRGMRVQYCNGEYSYTTDGVTVKMLEDGVKNHVFGIFSALELLADSDVSFNDGEENIFNLSSGNRFYTYNVDGHSGRLTQVKSDFGEITFRY